MSCPGSSGASPLKALLDTELGKFGVVAQALVREPCAVPATPQLRIDCGGRDAKRGGNFFGAQACLNHLLDFLPLLIRAESVVCQCVHLLTGIKKLSYTTNLLVCNSMIGAALDETDQVGLDQFVYLKDFDAYYLVHSDAIDPRCRMLSASRNADGSVNLICKRDTGSAAVLLLRTITGWQITANELFPE